MVEDGFAHITRDGAADIYLIHKVDLAGGHGASIAFDLDDFDTEKNVGHPLVRAKAPYCGLLPTVRAVERLRRFSVAQTAEHVRQVTEEVLADHQRRRALLP
jgi:hypothetical protein